MAKLAYVFLLSIVLMASLASLSHGLLINGQQITAISVQGFFRCTLTSDLNAPPISATTVVLNCGGSNSNVGQTLTNPAGFFTITYKIVDTILFDPSSCRVTVNLPVAKCSLFPPDGVLTAFLGLVNVAQTSVGNIANYSVGIFRKI